ncbi:hypothetical protein [Klebsiella phage vB_KpnP-VAC71]|uniref:Uncharacterized protein n=1 Tax=Klebsiella phage vB_KpnP-VAC71 TaxID=2866700 RepID=A0AAE9C6U8_9CAUD|nr:hypothetical protein [Klebsiella phage vB_KpnP-VAC71]
MSHYYKGYWWSVSTPNQLGITIGRHLKYYYETITIKTTITIGLHKV